MISGRVESFDAKAGVGWVIDDRHGRWPFHCTEIEDGSREIEPGQRVTFLVAAGGPGTWQAKSLRNGAT